MKTVGRAFINVLGIIAITSSWFPSGVAQEDVATIIHQSSEANQSDLAAVPEFDNDERDRNKEGRQDIRSYHALRLSL